MDEKTDLDIPEDILLRKGARKGADIPDHIRNLLQSGHIESVNLTEWLAVDHILLFQQVAHELEMDAETREITEQLIQMNEQRIMKIIPTIAANWLNLMERMGDKKRTRIFRSLAEHRFEQCALLGGLYHRIGFPFESDSKAGSYPPLRSGSPLWCTRDCLDGCSGANYR